MQFIDVIDQTEVLFQMEPIAAIIVGTTEDAYSRVLALQTVKRQLTSICLQHGALMGDEAFYQFSRRATGCLESMKKTGM